MPNQTTTRVIESDLEPTAIYKVLADASNIPKWAPVFADSIEEIGDPRCRLAKNGKSFMIEVVRNPSAGTVDYILEMAGGVRGGAHIRVTPRPLGGSVVTMNVPLGPNAVESDVAKVLEQELADLIKLAQA